MADDPFTQAYDAIWTLLETDTELKELVKPGNRIKLTKPSPHPYKESVIVSDLPEITLEPGGCHLRPVATSTGAAAVQRYDVTLAGQDLSIKKKFNAVKWRIMCAFAKQNLNLGLSFVKRCEILDGDDSIVEVEKDFCWSYKFTIEVEMWWARSSF